ncbi:MAG: DUF4973 domain-containing protein [Prevotellaceae bacterium]|jgi:hypothetical protein|nr:DUF4973 domain-containing protein [Prevotellaceae bacterium]
MKTKKIYALLALAALCLLSPACNDEWTDEQYQKNVSFVRSIKNNVSNVYLKYRSDGVASYKIPLVVSGSTGNDRDVAVTVAIDPDTLDDLNFDRFRYQTKLYFKLLEEQYYEFPNGATATIPAGKDVGLLDINFRMAGLDLVDKYVLPLKIESTSTYAPAPRREYIKTLMRIVPFNDFSGVYTPTGGELWLLSNVGAEVESLGAYEEQRETRVVDESTVFFYAGQVQELEQERALYKIRMRFNSDNSLTLTADSARIEFADEGSTYELSTTTDPTKPYLKRHYTVIKLTYSFKDFTNPQDPIHYRVKNVSMRMERLQNTLIPEEDQQFIFE